MSFLPSFDYSRSWSFPQYWAVSRWRNKIVSGSGVACRQSSALLLIKLFLRILRFRRRTLCRLIGYNPRSSWTRRNIDLLLTSKSRPIFLIERQKFRQIRVPVFLFSASVPTDRRRPLLCPFLIEPVSRNRSIVYLMNILLIPICSNTLKISFVARPTSKIGAAQDRFISRSDDAFILTL